MHAPFDFELEDRPDQLITAKKCGCTCACPCSCSGEDQTTVQSTAAVGLRSTNYVHDLELHPGG